MHTFVALTTRYSIVAILVLACSKGALGNEALLRRFATFWNEYENISLKGKAKLVEGSGDVQEREFVFNIGKGENGQLPPWEILLLIPNPGEPHIDSEMVVDEAFGFDGKLGFQFRRKYVSSDPPSERLSEYFIYSVPGAAGLAQYVRLSLLRLVDIPISEFGSFDPQRVVSKNRVEVLGEESFLGVNATKILLSIQTKDESGIEKPPIMQVTALVALEPTFQMLETLDIKAEAGATGPFTAEQVLKLHRGSRRIESLKVINKWLICERSNFDGPDGTKAFVEVASAEDLPVGYVGMWDYKSISGAVFGGDAEMTTRPKHNRMAYEHTKNFTFVPFAKADKDKIREYLHGKAEIVDRKVSWSTFGLWILGGVVISTIVLYLGNHSRQKNAIQVN